ncbi:unnamed protein product, partial [Prorocentrum cordatum]
RPAHGDDHFRRPRRRLRRTCLAVAPARYSSPEALSHLRTRAWLPWRCKRTSTAVSQVKVVQVSFSVPSVGGTPDHLDGAQTRRLQGAPRLGTSAPAPPFFSSLGGEWWQSAAE